MAVAWVVGAWANDSWLGMNAGPPNAWRGESTPVPVVVTDLPGGSSDRKRKRKKGEKPRVIRWSDFATQEERAEALARELADAAIPVADAAATPDALIAAAEEIEDEEEALMHALILSRIIH